MAFDNLLETAAQVDENPLAAGEWSPVDLLAEDAERAQREQEAWFHANLETVHQAALDPDKFYEGKDLSFGRTRGEAQQMAISDSFLALMNGGEAPGGDSLSRRLYMQEVSVKRWGREVTTDAEFAAEVSKEAQGLKDERDLIGGSDAATAESSLAGKLRSAVLEGGDWRGAFLEWQKGAEGDARYKRERLGVYQEAAQKIYEEESRRVEAARPYAEEVFAALQEEKERSGAYGGEKAVAALQKAPKEHRALAIALLFREAEKEGAKQGKGGHAWQTFARGMAKQMVLGPSATLAARDLVQAEEALAKMKPGDEFGGRFDNLLAAARGNNEGSLEGRMLGVIFEPLMKNQVATAESIEEAKQELARQKERFEISKQLEAIAQGSLDPLRADGWIQEKITYPFLSGVAPSVASVVLTRSVTGSGVGAVVPMWGMMADDNAQQYLRQNPEMGFAQAYQLGERAAYLQSGLEYAETALTLGSGKLLGNALRTAQASAYKTFGKAAAANLAGQNLLEGVQDVIPYFVQELDATAPDADAALFFYGRDGEPGYWTQRIDTFWAMLPAVAMGAGGATLRAKATREELERAAAATQNERMLKAAGIVEESRQAILAEADPGKRLDLFGAALKMADPQVAKEGQAELDAARVKQEQAQADGELAGIVPRVVKAGEAWTVYDPETGDEVGKAATPAEGSALATAHMERMQEVEADQVAYLASLLEFGDKVTEKGDGPGERTVLDLRVGEEMTAEQMAARSEKDEARVLEQARAREALGETPGFADIVLGESITELRRGVREMTLRLFRGGSVLTLGHEDAHRMLRKAQAKGLLQRDELVRLGRALDTVLAGKKTRDGRPLRFLPENDAEITDTLLDEMVAELWESEILRRRKTSGAYGAAPGIISRNLGALSRIAAGPVKNFKAFVDAFRDLFGLALGRAQALRKGIKEGTIQEAQLDEFAARLSGLQEQDEVDAEAARHAEEILGGEVFEGDPFAMAGSKVADALRKDALRRIKDPVRRTQAMSKVARKMEEARLELERIELTGGTLRVRRSLVKEAAMREVLRRQELENETWARHMAVLTDEDLTKLKAQPGHALLSDPKSPLRGRLMSRTAALKKHPHAVELQSGGDYDGSESVSRSVFGGDLMPDQAAQEMYDTGLIKEPTPEAMWELLEAEGKSVAKMREFLEVAKEELREGRLQAKDETNAWLREQEAIQKDPEQAFSNRQEMIRMLGLLDGILSVVPAEVRGKVGGYTQLARIGTNEARLKFLKERMAMMDTALETWMKRELDREFFALLERARPEKDEAGQKPRGKIGADVHELFASIREAMLLSGGEAEAEALRLESLAASGEYTPEQESHLMLEANLIRLVGDWGKADAARREAALVEATRIFEEGYLQHRVEISQKRERRHEARGRMKAATKSSGAREERRARQKKDEGTKFGRFKRMKASLLSFEQLLHEAFGLKSEDARYMADWERRASNAKADAIQNKLDAIDDLFSSLAGSKFKGEELRWKMSRPDAIKVDGQTFSELEAITATLMWRQEDGRRHMEGHKDEVGNPAGEWNYTEDFMERLEAKLSPQAKAVRLHLGEQYAAEYDRLNAIYRDLYGVSLPRHKHYSPLTVKPQQAPAGQLTDPVTGFSMTGNGFTPGSLRSRSQSAIAEPEFRDAVQTYIAHVRQMEHWMAYAPFATEAMALLNTRELGNSVEAAAGKETLGVLRSWLDYFAQGGTKDASAHLAINATWNKVTSRFAAMALVGRVSVLAIQSLQLGAGLAQMPTGAYLVRFAKLMTGRLGWGDALNSGYIRRRKAQMPAVVQQALEGLNSGKPARVKYAVRKLGETIPGADALFTAGTFAMIYDYQLGQAKKLGLSGAEAKAYALEEAERSTERVAQPVRPGTRSFYEVSATDPARRVVWAFASEARQKFALAVLGHSDRSAGEKARAVAVAWLVGGVVATVIRSVMRDLRDDGEDDELFDERNWDPGRFVLSSLTGPLGGIPLLGEMIEGGLFAAAGEYVPSGTLLDTGKNAAKAAKHVPDWFSGERDLDAALKDAEAMITLAGMASESAAAGTSLMHLIRDAFAVAGNVPE
jgi:hypothetical protein